VGARRQAALREAPGDRHNRAGESLRDKDALARLSPEEQQACQALWAGVAALLHKAQASAK
jgi:hypothetical protein